jgi:hypothetical protein
VFQKLHNWKRNKYKVLSVHCVCVCVCVCVKVWLVLWSLMD